MSEQQLNSIRLHGIVFSIRKKLILVTFIIDLYAAINATLKSEVGKKDEHVSVKLYGA
jgi:hypothetical protein